MVPDRMRRAMRCYTPDKVGDINAIATLDAIVTSAVMSHWLHRRLERRR